MAASRAPEAYSHFVWRGTGKGEGYTKIVLNPPWIARHNSRPTQRVTTCTLRRLIKAEFEEAHELRCEKLSEARSGVSAASTGRHEPAMEQIGADSTDRAQA
jgi:hypothetical protein